LHSTGNGGFFSCDGNDMKQHKEKDRNNHWQAKSSFPDDGPQGCPDKEEYQARK
jgi:hypothetical protein